MKDNTIKKKKCLEIGKEILQTFDICTPIPFSL